MADATHKMLVEVVLSVHELIDVISHLQPPETRRLLDGIQKHLSDELKRYGRTRGDKLHKNARQ